MQDYNEKEGLIICKKNFSNLNNYSLYFDCCDSGGHRTGHVFLDLGHVQEA